MVSANVESMTPGTHACLELSPPQLSAIQQYCALHCLNLQELQVRKALQGTPQKKLNNMLHCSFTKAMILPVTVALYTSVTLDTSAVTAAATLGLPPLSVRIVTRLTVPQDWKCSCSSSGVQA